MQTARSLTEWKKWDGTETIARLRADFAEAVLEEHEFRGERTVVVDPQHVADILAYLRDEPECDFAMLSDVTAVHWPQRDRQFDVIWHLYSLSRNVRLRVKCRVQTSVASATALWRSAGWLERECYDMFGLVFEGHPDLRRILMPEDYEGHPLRKEFPLKK
jgi:NADH-quinone oxidoreductase subunit C